jgi:hypothetical protein
MVVTFNHGLVKSTSSYKYARQMKEQRPVRVSGMGIRLRNHAVVMMQQPSRRSDGTLPHSGDTKSILTGIARRHATPLR